MPNQPFKPKKKMFGARFTSTLSVALVLFVLGLGALGGLAVVNLAKVMREQFTVTIVLNESATEVFTKKLIQDLNKAPYTARTVYISADSALQIVTRELGENPEDFLGYNPLQASVELQMRAPYAVRDSIAPIMEALKAGSEGSIDSIDYNAELLDVVNANLHRSAIFFIILAAVLVLISMTLVANTVRLALHADRFIIGTMRLVGATNWFIRRPFVMGQMWHGLLAAFIAMGAIAALVYLGIDAQGSAGDALAQMILDPIRVSIVAAGLVLVGMFIPFVAAWGACNKYLHCTTDELYLM